MTPSTRSTIARFKRPGAHNLAAWICVTRENDRCYRCKARRKPRQLGRGISIHSLSSARFADANPAVMLLLLERFDVRDDGAQTRVYVLLAFLRQLVVWSLGHVHRSPNRHFARTMRLHLRPAV